MNRHPIHLSEHADYRARIVAADQFAARLSEALRRNEPWAVRLAAVLEERFGSIPACHCDACGGTGEAPDA